MLCHGKKIKIGKCLDRLLRQHGTSFIAIGSWRHMRQYENDKVAACTCVRIRGLFRNTLGESADAIHRQIQCVYRTNAMSVCVVKSWRCQFLPGKEDVRDEER